MFLSTQQRWGIVDSRTGMSLHSRRKATNAVIRHAAEVGTPFSPLGLVVFGDEILVQRNAAHEVKSPSSDSKFISPVLRPLRLYDRTSVKVIQSL